MAIAADTTKRRVSTEGEALFLTSGLVWLQAVHPCTVSFDGEKDIDLQALIMAFRLVLRMAAGFKARPHAPDDGLHVHGAYHPHLLVCLAWQGLVNTNSRIIKSCHLASVTSQARPYP